MNRLLIGFILVSLGLVAGYLGQGPISEMIEATGLASDMQLDTSENKSKEETILYWVAPMDANYRRDEPGQSPMGMDLVPVYAEESKVEEEIILYWVAPMDANYRRDEPGKSPMGMDLVPVYADSANEDGVVKISAAVENNLGVRVSKVKQGLLNRSINTVGYVGFDEEKIFHVHSRVEGWVEKLTVKTEGETVRKGQKLFELYSPDLVNAQEEYLTALRSNNSILINASKTRLRLLGVGDGQINQLQNTRSIRQRIDYFSEHEGFISELNIREGMYIKPATDVLSIGQIDTVWVIAEVFERQSGWIKIDQPVDMTVGALPGQSWQGRVDYIYPVLDAKTRTLRVRIRFDNPEEKLKPNMYARLEIQAQTDQETLFIPREALIRSGKMDRVVKSLGDGKFISVAVRAGIESDDAIEILEGLDAGEAIVTSAQFLIDSESSLTASFERMQEPADEMMESSMKPSMNVENDDMQDESQAWVKGSINSIDQAQSKLNLNHEPVEVWGWPSMMMDFPVSPSLDISNLKENQTLEVLVKKYENGSIEIVQVKQGN